MAKPKPKKIDRAEDHLRIQLLEGLTFIFSLGLSEGSRKSPPKPKKPSH
jgi:hypothetical protein